MRPRFFSIHSLFVKLFFYLSIIACALTVGKVSAESDLDGLNPIRIAVSKTPLSAPFYVAHQKGYFKAQGLEVELVECIGGHRCLKEVLAGNVDLGTASESPVMFNSFERSDYAVIATFVSSTNDVKIIANRARGIVKPKHLKGRRIGTVTGASSHFFLDIFLLFHGIKPSEVEVVKVNPEDMPKALKAGEVDALSVWEPFGYITVKELGQQAVLFPSSDLYRESFNLVCLKSYCQDNGMQAQLILKALKQGIDYINNEERDSQEIISSRLSLESEFIDWIWPDFNFELALDQTLVLTLESEARWAVEKQLVNQKPIPNFLDIIEVGPISELDPNLITIIE